MSFKLYDFDKEIIPEELDEQIRLICDILYNKREEYPQQLIPTSFPYGLPKLSPPVSPFLTHAGFIIINQAGSSYDNFNGAGVILISTPVVSAPDTETPAMRMAKHTTTTTINSKAGVRIAVNSASGNWILYERNPYFEWLIKLDSDTLTNHTIGIGFAQGSQVAVDAYTAAQSVGTGVSGFFYDSTINSGRWFIRFKRRLNGAGSDTTTDVDTGITPVNGRHYTFRMKFNMAKLDTVNFNSNYNISWSIEEFDFARATGMSNYKLTQGLVINEQMPDYDVNGVNDRTHENNASIKNIVGGVGTIRPWYILYGYQETELPGVR